jgi:hypothetical protein
MPRHSHTLQLSSSAFEVGGGEVLDRAWRQEEHACMMAVIIMTMHHAFFLFGTALLQPHERASARSISSEQKHVETTEQRKAAVHDRGGLLRRSSVQQLRENASGATYQQ